MIRLKNALKTDLLFQYKEGFFAIYIAICLIYLVILAIIPSNYLSIVIPLVIFSDPAGIGLFFIGGIIMLEKKQGSIHYLIVTPLRTQEYIYSKLISFSLLASWVGIIITYFSNYNGVVNLPFLLLGTIATATFFTNIGIILSVKCSSLNQYFIKMVPWMILLMLPCLSLLQESYNHIFSLIPSVAGLRIIYGSFNHYTTTELFLLTCYLSVFNYFMLSKVNKIFDKSIVYGGTYD